MWSKFIVVSLAQSLSRVLSSPAWEVEPSSASLTSSPGQCLLQILLLHQLSCSYRRDLRLIPCRSSLPHTYFLDSLTSQGRRTEDVERQVQSA